MEKEIKEVNIKVRVSKREKEQLDNYCAANNIKVSAAIRLALAELMGKLD